MMLCTNTTGAAADMHQKTVMRYEIVILGTCVVETSYICPKASFSSITSKCPFLTSPVSRRAMNILFAIFFDSPRDEECSFTINLPSPALVRLPTKFFLKCFF